MARQPKIEPLLALLTGVGASCGTQTLRANLDSLSETWEGREVAGYLRDLGREVEADRLDGFQKLLADDPDGEPLRALLTLLAQEGAGAAALQAAAGAANWERVVLFPKRAHPKRTDNYRDVVSKIWEDYSPALLAMVREKLAPWPAARQQLDAESIVNNAISVFLSRVYEKTGTMDSTGWQSHRGLLFAIAAGKVRDRARTFAGRPAAVPLDDRLTFGVMLGLQTDLIDLIDELMSDPMFHEAGNAEAILRLYLGGESRAGIAATLGITRSQVEFTLRRFRDWLIRRFPPDISGKPGD